MSRYFDLRRDDREAAIAAAAEALQRGELVVLPTDTVYGVAADPFRPGATRRVFAVKGRGRHLPLPVLVHTHKQLAGLVAELPPAAERLIAAFWPGALTIVLRATPHLAWDIGDNRGTVGVRMPRDEIALEVIRAVGPLAVTSANRSGEPPATDAAAAREALGDGVAVYLDDGPRTELAPSTVVDLTGSAPRIVRAGALDPAEVLRVAQESDGG